LNTQFGINQKAYDKTCPDTFQINEFGMEHGVVDMVVDEANLLSAADSCIRVLMGPKTSAGSVPDADTAPESCDAASMDYLESRNLDRYDATDIVEQLCSSYVELGGDGKGPNGLDKCLDVALPL